jgi:hypothetical protein
MIAILEREVFLAYFYKGRIVGRSRSICSAEFSRRQLVLIFTTEAECHLSALRAVILLVLYTNAAYLANPVAIMGEVVIGNAEGLEECSDSLICFLGVSGIKYKVEPEATAVS